MKKNIILILIVVLVLVITGCTNTENTAENENEAVENTVEAVEEETSEATAETSEVSSEPNIVNVSDDDFHDLVDNSEGIVIVDFWAEWCPPCVELGPILEEVSAEEGVTLYKVNVDESPKLAQEFRIMSIPMVYIYKDGEIVDSQLGVGTKRLYISKIEEHR